MKSFAVILISADYNKGHNQGEAVLKYFTLTSYFIFI